MKISVVIPYFNPQPSHFAAMLAGLGQADWSMFTALEFIFINDGGTKPHSDHFAALRTALPTLTTFTIQEIDFAENRGVSCARNTGMAAATGDWIALHDADDISLRLRFAVSVAFLQQHPEVIAVAGDMQVFNEQGNTAIRLFPMSHAEICVDQLFYCAMAQPAMVLNRQRWLDSGVRYTANMDMAQDWDFTIRLSQHGELANLGIPLVRYRQHPSQRSSGILRDDANPYVRHIWQTQLQNLGCDPCPQTLKVHSLLAPYWLWQINERAPAWLLDDDAVLHWGHALQNANQSQHYVDAKLLEQKVSRLQQAWRAWKATGPDPLTMQRLA
ncbi:glycosyltransferase family 2 protein [Deefgea salmonis]|uniref:Glycosyltransferase n=1 Tax=Deefgea salmonis TaxID=2875502 RepID=A0ABS8BNY8_9NEIS|nr:glycosyltransferase [Deefgea salmonis]MCB5197332.1 glycosyltransferase [Deefgea salmonis]